MVKCCTDLLAGRMYFWVFIICILLYFFVCLLKRLLSHLQDKKQAWLLCFVRAVQKFVTTKLVLRFPVCSCSVAQDTRRQSVAAVVLEIGISDMLWGREKQTLLRSCWRHPVEETKPQTLQHCALKQWQVIQRGRGCEVCRGSIKMKLFSTVLNNWLIKTDPSLFLKIYNLLIL